MQTWLHVTIKLPYFWKTKSDATHSSYHEFFHVENDFPNFYNISMFVTFEKNGFYDRICLPICRCRRL